MNWSSVLRGELERRASASAPVFGFSAGLNLVDGTSDATEVEMLIALETERTPSVVSDGRRTGMGQAAARTVIPRT